MAHFVPEVAGNIGIELPRLFFHFIQHKSQRFGNRGFSETGRNHLHQSFFHLFVVHVDNIPHTRKSIIAGELLRD